MEDKKLTEKCKVSIENNKCLGCQRLENKEFIGVEKCNYVEIPKEKILGIQQKIKNV